MRIFVRLTALGLLVSCLACGVKGDPSPPLADQPEAKPKITQTETQKKKKDQ